MTELYLTHASHTHSQRQLSQTFINWIISLFQHQIFRDPNGGLGQKNAWFAGDVRFGDVNTQTARAVDDRLFEHVAPGEKTHLFDLVLDALEQEDYCQFEVGCCGATGQSDGCHVRDLYFCVSVCLSLSVCLFVYLFVCLSCEILKSNSFYSSSYFILLHIFVFYSFIFLY